MPAKSRLTSAHNPESGATAYTYDPAGNLESRQDARPVTTSLMYDARSRIPMVIVQRTRSDYGRHQLVDRLRDAGSASAAWGVDCGAYTEACPGVMGLIAINLQRN